MDKGMFLSVIIGLVIGLLLAVVLITVIIRSDNSLKGNYDERQELNRGRAYKGGFYSILVYCGVIWLMGMARYEFKCDAGFLAGLGASFGLMVFGVITVALDAYLALNDRPGTTIGSMAVIAIVNYLIFMMNYYNGLVVRDGKLTSTCVNLMLAIVITVILGAVMIKRLMDKGGGDEES